MLVQSHRFNGLDEKITLSFGIAQLDENDDKKSLFQKADAALYEAKKKGRNRVEIYNPLL
jgi:diguanylate cyclase (GGDEF)-like protein